MKKIILFLILCFLPFSLLNADNFKLKHPLPIFYTHENIRGIIEIATFDITDEVSENLNDLTSNIAIDKRVKKYCDYLTSKGLEIPQTIQQPFGVPMMSSQTQYYSYPSWDVKITDYEGARTIEVIDKNVQKNLISHNPAVIAGLPFRIIFFTDKSFKRTFLHLCMVNPIDYIGQFINIDSYTSQILMSEISKFIQYAKDSFGNEPECYIKTVFSKKYPDPDIPSLVKIAQVYTDKDLEQFVKEFIHTGDILTTLGNGNVVRYVAHKPDDENFPYSYDPSYLNESQTEVTGFLSFCRFILPTKNIWLQYMPDNYTINYMSMMKLMQEEQMLMMKGNNYFNLPKSEPMEFLIKNSLTFPYARYYPDNFTEEKYITFSYNILDGKKVYQIKYFDPYIDPVIMTLGTWHLAIIPRNIYFFKNSNLEVEIYAQNPVFLMEKYFSDISDSSLSKYAEIWNASPTTMYYWPNMTKKEMGEFTLNKLKKLINKTLEIMGY